MLEQLLFAGVDRVLGLGYLKKVEEDVINYFQEKLWNIHPSLIPKHSGFGYYGLKVHDSVIESGDEYTGVTIHMMTKIWDDPNAILNQIRVPVFSGESPKDLQQRILPFEYELMRSTLDLYSKNLLPNCKRS